MGEGDKEFTLGPVGFAVPGVMQIELPSRQVTFGGRSELEILGSHRQRDGSYRLGHRLTLEGECGLGGKRAKSRTREQCLKNGEQPTTQSKKCWLQRGEENQAAAVSEKPRKGTLQNRVVNSEGCLEREGRKGLEIVSVN